MTTFNIILFILLGLSVGLNWSFYKICKELKAKVVENDRDTSDGDN